MAEQDGEPVSYITSQGEELLKGSVRIDATEAGPSGILCACCNGVISCSQFEAHAGRGSRRAPYDNIFTAAGVSLRKLACLMPASEAESPISHRPAALCAVADRCNSFPGMHHACIPGILQAAAVPHGHLVLLTVSSLHGTLEKKL